MCIAAYRSTRIDLCLRSERRVGVRRRLLLEDQRIQEVKLTRATLLTSLVWLLAWQSCTAQPRNNSSYCYYGMDIARFCFHGKHMVSVTSSISLSKFRAHGIIFAPVWRFCVRLKERWGTGTSHAFRFTVRSGRRGVFPTTYISTSSDRVIVLQRPLHPFTIYSFGYLTPLNAFALLCIESYKTAQQSFFLMLIQSMTAAQTSRNEGISFIF